MLVHARLCSASSLRAHCSPLSSSRAPPLAAFSRVGPRATRGPRAGGGSAPSHTKPPRSLSRSACAVASRRAAARPSPSRASPARRLGGALGAGGGSTPPAALSLLSASRSHARPAGASRRASARPRLAHRPRTAPTPDRAAMRSVRLRHLRGAFLSSRDGRSAPSCSSAPPSRGSIGGSRAAPALSVSPHSFVQWGSVCPL